MKLVRKLIALAVAVTAFGACNNAPSPEYLRLIEQGKTARLINVPDPEELKTRDLIQEYEAFMDDKISEEDLPGAAYAIVKNGKIISMKTYGVCKKGRSEEIDKHTVFNLASVSKGFASVLAGIMVEKGYINWNDKIIDYLPKFKLKENTQELTLRHTLSHTTGIQKSAGNTWINQNLPYTTILKKVQKIDAEAKPAKVFAYQNVLYSLIGEVAKVTTKMSYEELLDSLIFKPLAMKDASAGYKSMLKTPNKGLPHVFNSQNGWQSEAVRPNWYNVAPAAGVNASISDMAIWLQAMMGHHPDVISKALLHEIYKPHISLPDDIKYYQKWAPGLAKASYGLGWRIFDYNENKIIYHGGFINGYRPEIGFCPKEDIGIVFLTNTSNNEVSSVCVRAFFDMYFAPKIAS